MFCHFSNHLQGLRLENTRFAIHCFNVSTDASPFPGLEKVKRVQEHNK